MITTIYVKTESKCVQCDATLRKFEELGLEYMTVSAENSLDMLKELGHTSAPVVIPDLVPGWGGYRPDLIETLKPYKRLYVWSTKNLEWTKVWSKPDYGYFVEINVGGLIFGADDGWLEVGWDNVKERGYGSQEHNKDRIISRTTGPIELVEGWTNDGPSITWDWAGSMGYQNDEEDETLPWLGTTEFGLNPNVKPGWEIINDQAKVEAFLKLRNVWPIIHRED